MRASRACCVLSKVVAAAGLGACEVSDVEVARTDDPDRFEVSASTKVSSDIEAERALAGALAYRPFVRERGSFSLCDFERSESAAASSQPPSTIRADGWFSGDRATGRGELPCGEEHWYVVADWWLGGVIWLESNPIESED